MIIYGSSKFIKREKDNLYFRSRGINPECGRFCDYSKTEDSVEIESPCGERSWFPIALFFYSYSIREGANVGVFRDKKVCTYQIGEISERLFRGCSYLYALLIPTGFHRELDIDKDFPFTKLEHDLPLTGTPTTTNEVASEMNATTRSLLDKNKSYRDIPNFMFFKGRDGLINLSVYKKHIEMIFEPHCRGYKTIARVYTHSGELVKQWKGISFSQSCDRLARYCEQTDDNTAVPATEISFRCENGEIFPSEEYSDKSIYDLFPTLPRYEY